jgi:hypothetical protein
MFSGILEKGNLFEQKKILAGKKFTEQKSFFAEQERLSLLILKSYDFENTN